MNPVQKWNGVFCELISLPDPSPPVTLQDNNESEKIKIIIYKNKHRLLWKNKDMN